MNKLALGKSPFGKYLLAKTRNTGVINIIIDNSSSIVSHYQTSCVFVCLAESLVNHLPKRIVVFMLDHVELIQSQRLTLTDALPNISIFISKALLTAGQVAAAVLKTTLQMSRKDSSIIPTCFCDIMCCPYLSHIKSVFTRCMEKLLLDTHLLLHRLNRYVL